MIITLVQKNTFLRKIVCSFGERRATFLIESFSKFLQPKSKIIDVGAGVCNIARQLDENGHKVVALDVVNLSMVKDFEPLIYDGTTIPYPDKYFDTGLLVTVLHHVRNQDTLVTETARVSKRLIIIEDIYTGIFSKYVTYLFDSIFNLEFIGHPHSNRTDQEWKRYFKTQNLRLVGEESMGSYLVFRHKVYVLEKP